MKDSPWLLFHITNVTAISVIVCNVSLGDIVDDVNGWFTFDLFNCLLRISFNSLSSSSMNIIPYQCQYQRGSCVFDRLDEPFLYFGECESRRKKVCSRLVCVCDHSDDLFDC